MDEFVDFYAVLGVAPNASAELIKSAYRSAMWEQHPDHGGDTKSAQVLNEAYEWLGSPDRRAAYDLMWADRLSGGVSQPQDDGVDVSLDPYLADLLAHMTLLEKLNFTFHLTDERNLDVDMVSWLEDHTAYGRSVAKERLRRVRIQTEPIYFLLRSQTPRAVWLYVAVTVIQFSWATIGLGESPSLTDLLLVWPAVLVVNALGLAVAAAFASKASADTSAVLRLAIVGSGAIVALNLLLGLMGPSSIDAGRLTTVVVASVLQFGGAYVLGGWVSPRHNGTSWQYDRSRGRIAAVIFAGVLAVIVGLLTSGASVQSWIIVLPQTIGYWVALGVNCVWFCEALSTSTVSPAGHRVARVAEESA